jgi:hypothetical protein
MTCPLCWQAAAFTRIRSCASLHIIRVKEERNSEFISAGPAYTTTHQPHVAPEALAFSVRAVISHTTWLPRGKCARKRHESPLPSSSWTASWIVSGRSRSQKTHTFCRVSCASWRRRRSPLAPDATVRIWSAQPKLRRHNKYTCSCRAQETQLP